MSERRPSSPREHLVAPGLFGLGGAVEWRQPMTVDWLVDLRQAEIQHAFVVEVRRRIATRPGLNQRLIARGGDSDPRAPEIFAYRRLSDCLNGRRRLSLMDMQRIELVTGPILTGLRYQRCVVTDPDLCERFPAAVGEVGDGAAGASAEFISAPGDSSGPRVQKASATGSDRL